MGVKWENTTTLYTLSWENTTGTIYQYRTVPVHPKLGVNRLRSENTTYRYRYYTVPVHPKSGVTVRWENLTGTYLPVGYRYHTVHPKLGVKVGEH